LRKAIKVIPARFIAVVGPSGAGKDSILDYARMYFGDAGPVHIAQRTITRPACAGGESHKAVTEVEFQQIADAGGFALSWSAHGLRYGIPIAIEDSLASGKTVIANLSRSVLPHVRERYPVRQIIVITASPSVLAERLSERGRESREDINLRLQRALSDLPQGEDVITIQNEGVLEGAAKAFLRIIEG
jgi:ribose 1,5-bisphosphokinase